MAVILLRTWPWRRRRSNRRIQIEPAMAPAARFSCPGMMGGQRQFKTGHRAHPRPRAGARWRRADPARAGPHLWLRRGAKGGAHRRRRAIRVPRPPGRPLYAAGDQVRVTSAFSTGRRVRSSPASQSSSPTSRASTTPTSACRAAASSAGASSTSIGDPIPDVSVTAMRQTWQDGRRRLVPSPGRIAQTQRPRTVPHLRPAAGRVLRQRVAAQRPAWSSSTCS